ncbi:unnamed protein product [Gadus morhua 'NCC']
MVLIFNTEGFLWVLCVVVVVMNSNEYGDHDIQELITLKHNILSSDCVFWFGSLKWFRNVPWNLRSIPWNSQSAPFIRCRLPYLFWVRGPSRTPGAKAGLFEEPQSSGG